MSEPGLDEVLPEERMPSAEAATGVARAVSRPDYPQDAGQPDEVDAARAREYALLAVLLAGPPDAALLDRIAKLRGDGTPLGVAHAALAQAADRASSEK